MQTLNSPDGRQNGRLSPIEVRATLLELTREFVLEAQKCFGVTRIAIVGSILTSKPRPKDVDLLVSVSDAVDLAKLAKLGRRLKGTSQAKLNSGADVFLATEEGPVSWAGLPLPRVSSARPLPRASLRESAHHCG